LVFANRKGVIHILSLLWKKRHRGEVEALEEVRIKRKKSIRGEQTRKFTREPKGIGSRRGESQKREKKFHHPSLTKKKANRIGQGKILTEENRATRIWSGPRKSEWPTEKKSEKRTREEVYGKRVKHGESSWGN